MKKVLKGLIFSIPLVLISTVSIAFEEPIVISYAQQLTENFNQDLADAQLQQLSWSFHPQKISAQYAGNDFVLLKVKQSEDKVVTYNVHQNKNKNQTLLLILTLTQKDQLWVLEEAKLTWQCQSLDGQHFDTKPCSLAPSLRD
ncbi:hypothetical protein [Shewanella surugensis]|uniref:Uncharacterized protein n=1 Tax=Shewanella surugensis TaxID=212020 RepID=A0ABT0L6X0_9GAMM|nr:hypothetical protein [Shewanella surugensis]MCL1123130.1 hypothetical protein [Shewanella surugensis]